jgi:APA family basic amino acid/polyamine antiporter
MSSSSSQSLADVCATPNIRGATVYSSTERKPLGFWTAGALVVGAMLGGGIFGLPASLAAFGSISILAWIITAIGSIFLALTFIELNRMIPKTGGAFLYAYHAYGDYMGFAIAISYWFAWCVGCAGAMVLITSFLAPFWPQLNSHSPQYQPWLALSINVSLVWITIIINMLGIKVVGRVQLITNLLKVIPLLALCCYGLFKIHAANLIHYFNISGSSNGHALAGAAALTLWAFTGFEAAVVPADDVTSHRVIGWSTILGTLFTALLYIVITIVMLGIIPAAQLKNSASPFNDIATTLFGPEAVYWITACALITIVGTVNGGILILIQDAMAAAKNKLLPPIFGDTNNRFQTPIKSLLLSGVLMTVLLMMTINESLNKQFNFLILLSTLSLLIPYFISATAALILIMKNAKDVSRKRLLYVFCIASLGSIYAFWTFIGVGQEVIFYGCLFFFSTFWLHLIFKWSQWLKEKK